MARRNRRRANAQRHKEDCAESKGERKPRREEARKGQDALVQVRMECLEVQFWKLIQQTTLLFQQLACKTPQCVRESKPTAQLEAQVQLFVPKCRVEKKKKS